MNLTKKIICLSLIVILICNPVVTYAQSGTLAVSGGSIPEAGGKAVAVTFIMTVMQSLGMTIHLSQAAKDAGETASKWVDDMVDKWVADGAPIDVVSIISSGKGSGGGGSSGDDKNKIGPNGKIYLTATALYFIQKFLNWLKSRGDILPELPPNEIVNGTYYGSTLILDPGVNNVFKRYTVYKNGDITDTVKVCWCYLKGSNNYYDIFCYYPVSMGNCYLWWDECRLVNGEFVSAGNAHGAQISRNVSGYFYREVYYDTLNYIVNDNVLDITSLGFNSIESYLSSLPEWDEGGAETEDTAVIGDYDSADLNNPDNMYTEIDPSVLSWLQSQITENTNATISIAEYLKAIQESLNKKSNEEHNTENVKATDNETLTNVPVTVPEPEPYDITLPKDQDPGDITTVVSPPEGSEPATVPTETEPPSKTVPLMLFPLDDYFPFCIPFDVYHLLQKLSADPVAPSYTIGFTVYGTEVNYTISLDAFSSAMVIVRKMELLVCVVGLAIASRKIFTR